MKILSLKNVLENIMEKRENAGNQHFPHIPQCLLPYPKQTSIFRSPIYFAVLKSSKLDRSETVVRYSVKYKKHEVSWQMYSTRTMVISILHGSGMLALILQRQKESYMIFIPSVYMRHNLIWSIGPQGKYKNSRSRPRN